MNKKIKPCPFCGGEPTLFGLVEISPNKQNLKLYSVECQNSYCPMTVHTELHRTQAAAIRQWNDQVGVADEQS